MGIAGFFVHRSTKKQIKTNLDWCRRISPDQRAGLLFHLWLSRGINLADVSGLPEVFIPIYYYTRGAEVALGELLSIFTAAKSFSMLNAINYHYFTNLAVSYPDEGYGTLVREMWEEVLNNHTEMREVFTEMSEIIADPRNEAIIRNNDVPVADFIANPSVIVPHFLVPGHPLSARLLEADKAGRFILKK